MIIRFTKEETNNIIIKHIPPKHLSEEYIQDREKIWLKRIQLSKLDNFQLWNGHVFTLENLNQLRKSSPIINLGLCEYKDIIFKNAIGIDKIIEEYGEDHLAKHISVDCIPVTKDNKFVFGIRGKNNNIAPGKLGIIGGSLNKDEMEIKEFRDFERYIQKEMNEEIGIKVEAEEFRFFSINHYYAKYQFLFVTKLPLSSSELLRKVKLSEFEELRFLTTRKVIEEKQGGIIAFNYCQKVIRQIDNDYLH